MRLPSRPLRRWDNIVRVFHNLCPNTFPTSTHSLSSQTASLIAPSPSPSTSSPASPLHLP
eukprot:m.34192 g.34192  ORF g.34192 m.34192 type:complete len:60 (-) comp16942_c0_seq3:380-559(-)